jgi:2-hydroxychromene-2-carboxylate isomerase
MTLGSGIDSAPLSVLLDIRYPHAYLALHPAAALARELAVEINWLPVQIPPLKAPSLPDPADDRGIRHRRYRAQAIAREIETYAGVQGLVLRDYYRDPDPSTLNLAWLWLRDRRPDRLLPFLTEAFRRYWTLELDPASQEAVASLVDSLDADGAGFQSWCAADGEAAAAGLAAELRERGLFGAPCYLVEEEVFIGRQHLPMIRWILQGRSGPVPI